MIDAPALFKRARRYRVLAIAIPVLSIAPAYAQNSDGGGAAAGGSGPGNTASGASQPSSSNTGIVYPSEVSGQSKTDTGTQDTRTSVDPYARASPFGYGELSYQPGSGGCAVPGLGVGGALADSGVFDTIEPVSERQRDRGRYLAVSLGGSETYTDNLNLQPDDQAISDFITTISPRLNTCASTGRVRGSLDLAAQGVLYQHESQFNDIYADVAGDTTITLIPRHFFLGADTRYGQRVIDPSISFSQSNVLRPGNQTGAWTSNVSPYYLQSLGPLGNAKLRYRYGATIYSDSDIPDTTLNGVYFDLTSPERFDIWSWQASIFTQKVHRSGGDSLGVFNNGADRFNPELFPDVAEPFADNTTGLPGNLARREADDPDTTHYDKATLQLGYQLTPMLKLLAQGGLEDDYQRDGTNDRLGSTVWNAGFRWASATNTLEARIGHRFFGTSYFVSASHTGRALNASIEYREEPSSQQLNSLNSNAIARSTSFSQPVTPLFDRGVFLEKKLSASVSLDSAVTRTTLSAFRQEREFQVSGIPDDTYLGGDLRVHYQVRPRIAIVPGISWQRRDRAGTDSYDTADAGISAVRAVSRSAQVSLGYGHSWRNSDNARSDYDANNIVVQFRKNF